MSDFQEYMDSLVITIAEKRASRLSEATGAITVFSGDEIRAMGIRNLSELFNYVPGMQSEINTTIDGQLDYTIARGSAGFGNDFLVMLDGQRLNNLHNNTASLFLRFIDVRNLARVEIMRGPASSLYGSNSIAGVINLITHKTGKALEVSAGSHERREAVVRYHDSRTDADLSWGLFYSFHEDDGERFVDFNPHSSFNGIAADQHPELASFRDPRTGQDLHLHLQFQEKIHASLKYQNRELEDYYLYSGGILPNVNRDETHSWLGSLAFTHRFNAALKAQLRFDGQWAEREGLHSPLPRGVAFAQADHFFGGPIQEYRLIESKLELEYDPEGPSHLVFGAETARAENPLATAQRNYDLLADPPQYLGEIVTFFDESQWFIDNQEQRTTGLFAQFSRLIRTRTKALVGLRWDDFRYGGNHVSPRLSVIHKPSERHVLRFIYAKAFRGPGLADLFEQNNLVSQGNPDLQSTTVKSYELGYEFISSRLTFATHLYTAHMHDVITLVPNPEATPGSPANLFANAGTQDTQGLELSAQWLVDDTTRLKVNFTHLFDTETDMEAAAGSERPEAFIARNNASVVLHRQWDHLHWNLNGYYRGSMEALERQDGYAVVNTRLGLRATDRLSLDVTVTNLFDEAYASPALGVGLGTNPQGDVVRELPRHRRWFFVGVQYRFSDP
ncbi:TonB-dependent receptor plug domain-containing protein [Sulfidibacter corallicola]|uniref:TonB-dependent receptor n=1 Tax=Sulfidibacter corallicola TaxID=2818388 RepID=A0A8A4THJ8_SULCO|nr:TonB-dependent receptor [Sulfidibacter corallicola]QTD48967.1 TonB-dependent receptor [Sulfidibacter corallicola]